MRASRVPTQMRYASSTSSNGEFKMVRGKNTRLRWPARTKQYAAPVVVKKATRAQRKNGLQPKPLPITPNRSWRPST